LRLIYIVGPSGAGKDSLLNGLRQDLASLDNPPPLYFAQRTITRSHHQSNEHHESVDESIFESLLKSDAFALNWLANGLHYGIRHTEMAQMSEGKWVMVNGSRAYLEEAKLRFPGLTVLHITAPIEILRTRLLSRGREDEQAIEARLESITKPLPLNLKILCLSNEGSLAESQATLKIFIAKTNRNFFWQALNKVIESIR
jgi:ribose 1,5-bisphosphokinase